MKTLLGLLQHSSFSGGLARIAFEPQYRSVAGSHRKSQSGSADADRRRVIQLTAGSVLRLDEGDVNNELIVDHGAIWLTDSPASQDYVLECGEAFANKGAFPWVIQALADSCLIIQ